VDISLTPRIHSCREASSDPIFDSASLNRMPDRGGRADNPAEAAQRVEESMRHAKEALSLDLTDSRSWYCMGNASLSMYFHCGASDPKHLRSALKAYQNAVRASRSHPPQASMSHPLCTTCGSRFRMDGANVGPPECRIKANSTA
jgi:hypothetical protein